MIAARGIAVMFCLLYAAPSGPSPALESVDPRRVDVALKQVSAFYQLNLAFEMAPHVPEDDGRSDVPALLHVAGLTGSDAVARIVAFHPGYTVRSLGTLTAVWPTNSPAQSWLDRRVPRFELRDATLMQAAQHIYRIYDPGFRAAPMSDAMATRFRARTGGDRMSLSLEHVTAREILNTIALRHGQLGWIVRYRRTAAGFRPIVQFFSWKGWSITVD